MVSKGYQPQAADISIEADLIDFHLLRQRTVEERVLMAVNLANSAKQLSIHCLSQQFAHLNPTQFARKIAEAWLQEDCPTEYIPKGAPMTWIQDSAELASQLHTVLTQAKVPYFITGGVAAIAYGDPRTTRDLDIVLQISLDTLADLQTALEQAGFYAAGIEEVASGRMKTLQITHIETISRADLIVADTDEFTQQQFRRKRRYHFPGSTEVYLASPEDIVISKLRWGLHSESQKQRRDVMAILKVQQAELDYVYISDWTKRFNIEAIFEEIAIASGVQTIVEQQCRSADH